MTNIAPKLNLKKPYIWAATWFGCGFMRPAPGTWGSLGALPFAVILYKLGGAELLLTATLIVTYIGIKVSNQFEKETGTKDNSMIVIDEVAGQWLTFVPTFYFQEPSWLMLGAGFALFRLFDITKIWPICWCDQKIVGGLGVMLDDIVAGLFAAIVLTGLVFYAGLS